ncbi:MAG: peptidoglycan-binding protein [Alphaproteobacteria bacterium]
MKRFVLSCTIIALSAGLAGCSNFKATDKLMRNDHKIIQNTRIHQKTEYKQVPVQMPNTYTSSVTQLPPAIEVKTLPTVTIQPTTVARTVVTRPVVEQINVRTLNRTNVIELQRALSYRGLYKAPIDGIFGIKTAQGLASYQSQMGEQGAITLKLLQSLGMFKDS